MYSPLVEEFLTTKQPSFSSCLSRDSDLCRDMSFTYHLERKISVNVSQVHTIKRLLTRTAGDPIIPSL